MLVLSHDGLVKLAEFLAVNLHEKTLRYFLDAWEDEVEIAEIDGQRQGHIEIHWQYTATKNPTTHTFSGEQVNEAGCHRLTDSGLRTLCEFLARNLSAAALRDLLHLYTSDVTNDDKTHLGSLTLFGCETLTGRKEVLEFGADELDDNQA